MCLEGGCKIKFQFKSDLDHTFEKLELNLNNPLTVC
jgi:hypothetical protein